MPLSFMLYTHGLFETVCNERITWVYSTMVQWAIIGGKSLVYPL